MIAEYEPGISNMLKGFMKKIFTDSADVYRAKEVVQGNQSVQNQYVLHDTKIKCRMSKVTNRKERQSEDLPESSAHAEARLYCDCDEDIIRGDRVEIDRGNFDKNKLTYYAGEPFCYASHLEIPLNISLEL